VKIEKIIQYFDDYKTGSVRNRRKNREEKTRERCEMEVFLKPNHVKMLEVCLELKKMDLIKYSIKDDCLQRLATSDDQYIVNISTVTDNLVVL